jgi:chorismate mutase-like protein
MNDQSVTRRSACLGDNAGSDPLDVITYLVVQRLTLGRDVAAIKYASGLPIDDSAREQEMLESVDRALCGIRLYQQSGKQFFRDQIEANKVIQRGLHQRWQLHPDEVLAVRRDLFQIRVELDSINTQMIRQVQRMDELPYLGRQDTPDLFINRYFAALPTWQLPRLHQAAALFALRSFLIAA